MALSLPFPSFSASGGVGTGIATVRGLREHLRMQWIGHRAHRQCLVLCAITNNNTHPVLNPPGSSPQLGDGGNMIPSPHLTELSCDISPSLGVCGRERSRALTATAVRTCTPPRGGPGGILQERGERRVHDIKSHWEQARSPPGTWKPLRPNHDQLSFFRRCSRESSCWRATPVQLGEKPSPMSGPRLPPNQTPFFFSFFGIPSSPGDVPFALCDWLALINIKLGKRDTMMSSLAHISP